LKNALQFEWDEGQRQADQDTRWIIESLSSDAIPAVICVRAAELIQHLVSEVCRAIQASKHPPSGTDDYSWIWRPAIEEHEQNHDFDAKSNIVGCLSTATEIAIRGRQLTLADVLPLIATPDLLVLGRLRLHLLRLFGEQSPQLVHEAVMNRLYF